MLIIYDLCEVWNMLINDLMFVITLDLYRNFNFKKDKFIL